MGFSRLGALMFNKATTPLLRAVLGEVRESVSQDEIGARTRVASKILEAATEGQVSPDGLRQIGHEALSRAPTMWS
jgi:DNA-binding transcriptional regulator YdaS (Cro superfamily)